LFYGRDNVTGRKRDKCAQRCVSVCVVNARQDDLGMNKGAGEKNRKTEWFIPQKVMGLPECCSTSPPLDGASINR